MKKRMMRRIAKTFAGLIFIYSTASMALASEFLSGVLEAVMAQTKNAGAQVTACDASALPTFRQANDFTRYVCENSDPVSINSTIQALLSPSGRAAISRFSSGLIRAEDFVESLRFFLRTNAGLPGQFNQMPTSPWELRVAGGPPDCRYSTNLPTATAQEIRFRNVSFVGVRHFYTQEPSQHSQARNAITQVLDRSRPDALILEGFEYGHSLSCEHVLHSVFTPDAEIHNESDLLLKQGFIRRIALVPGDNQRIDNEDLSLFFGGDRARLERIRSEMQIMDILHLYYSQLLARSDHPLEEAIARSATNWPGQVLPDVRRFAQLYREQNGQPLPTDPEQIYRDFTPSAFAQPTRGTNLLTDHQDELRNSSLIRSIQIASRLYSRPAVFFGSGHIAAVGAELNRRLGPMRNVDFVDACGPR